MKKKYSHENFSRMIEAIKTTAKIHRSIIEKLNEDGNDAEKISAVKDALLTTAESLETLLTGMRGIRNDEHKC